MECEKQIREKQRQPYDDVTPCVRREFWDSEIWNRHNSQFNMFFSSGAAQINGGGSFCMFTYSFVNCAYAYQFRGEALCLRRRRTRLWAAFEAILISVNTRPVVDDGDQVVRNREVMAVGGEGVGGGADGCLLYWGTPNSLVHCGNAHDHWHSALNGSKDSVENTRVTPRTRAFFSESSTSRTPAPVW